MSRLEDLGEQGFLDSVAGWLKTRNPQVKVGIGDDALVLADGTVLTSDSYEEALHFSVEYFTAEDIGFKSAAATLSDLAAMGAEPVCLLVNLFAPPQLEISFVKRLYSGLDEMCRQVNCEIAGGDTVSAEKLILSCTALGKTDKPLLRSGACPGDKLYVSGTPGLSLVGLRVLSMLSQVEDYEEAKARHLRPEPRISLGQVLTNHASACMDVSDGISTDACRLAKASGVKLVIEHQKLPQHPEIARYTEQYGGNWDSLFLDGGEDYELLFTSSQDLPDQLAGIPIHRIGRIEGVEEGYRRKRRFRSFQHSPVVESRENSTGSEEGCVTGVTGEGAFLEINGELKPLEARGWDHFSA